MKERELSLLDKKLGEFKPVDISSDIELDNSVFESLQQLLNRVARSQQKSSQSAELIHDEIKSLVSQHSALINDISETNAKLKGGLETIEKGLIDYIDILDELQSAARQLGDKNFSDTIDVALKAASQINERIGLFSVGSAGTAVDSEIHYVVNSRGTDSAALNDTVAEVVKCGYKIGDRLIRKASIIAFRKGGSQ